MRALPLLEPARSKLETCVFCPKLCRSACPVSNAEAARETAEQRQWGKMSLAYFVAHGTTPATRRPTRGRRGRAPRVPGVPGVVRPGDEVAPTLFDARSGMRELGVAPEARDAEVILGFPQARVRPRGRRCGGSAAPKRVRADLEGRRSWSVARTRRSSGPAGRRTRSRRRTGLSAGRVALVPKRCCGLPLLHAG